MMTLTTWKIPSKDMHTNHPELLTQSYDYHLPEYSIATHPARPADSAKLLIYDRVHDTITHTTFAHLLEFIPAGTHIFLNDTRVIKARIFGRKLSKEGQGGGRVELLFNKSIDAYTSQVMIRGRVKPGTIIKFDRGLDARVTGLGSDGSRTVSFSQDGHPLRFEKLVEILDDIGHIPLPPYIRRDDNKQDESDYQTLFAKEAGAVAAPTASLHFTPRLLDELRSQYPTHTLTLHVGAGTFKPVEAEAILDHPMHSEYFHVPDDSVRILQGNKPILAIGTTVTRTIEYFARTGKRDGECDLFLHPRNPPLRVNHLLTNFHLPKSTLIMLVSAFIGREKTLELYAEAIEKKYRFFSYGDGMLIV
jgi:S-adenosylmethionine:tRNA ribosyltransferase-isomerase